HSPREVCAGLIKLIDAPETSLQELVEIIPGPDFPTGGVIMGRQGILDGYARGRGKVTLRARAEVVEEGKGKSPVILIREVPFQVTRNRLAEAIGDLVKEERIAGISGIRVQVIRRRTEYLLREAKRRGHVLEGQLIAIANIEEVIRICRTAPNRAEAKQRLQEVEVPAALMERALGAEALAALQRELGSTA